MKQTKRMIALLLAATTAFSGMALSVSAETESTYRVAGIEDAAYFTDDDGLVNMSDNKGNTVAYGKIAYFPLLNDNYLGGGKAQAEAAYQKAKTAYETAKTDLGAAQTKLDEAKKAIDMLTDKTKKAKEAADSLAREIQMATNALDAAKQNTENAARIKALQTELADLEAQKKVAEAAIPTDAEVQNASKAATDAQASATKAQEDYAVAAANTFKAETDDLNSAYTAMSADPKTATAGKKQYDAYVAAQKAYDGYAKNETNGTLATQLYNYYKNATGAITAVEATTAETTLTTAGMDVTAIKTAAAASAVANEMKAVADAQKALDAAKADVKKLQDASVKANAADTAAQAAVTALTKKVTDQKAAVAKLTKQIADKTNEIKALPTARGVQQDLEALQKQLDELNKKKAAADQEVTKLTEELAKKTDAGGTVAAQLDTAKKAVTTAETTLKAAQTALNNANNANYPYVYETDAGNKISVRAKWEQGGNLVSKTEIVKKRMSYNKTPGWMTAEGAQRYAYFLAITLKPSTATRSQDLYGTIELRKSGTNGWSSGDVKFEPYLTVEYAAPKNSDVIPKTAALFADTDFDDTEDQEFRFEADDNSYFTVDTRGQGKVLLGMDCKYNSDIAEVYPEANLDFYNGNGGSFNKIGTMTLHAPDGSYLYKVNQDGTLSKVTATYDRYEEAFVFRTRTLDRYVVSDRVLKLVTPSTGSSSSDASSSGSISAGSSSSGSITIVPAPGGTHTNPPTGAAI